MPSATQAVPRNLASKTKKPPASAADAHPRRKCGLADERAAIVTRWRRSKVEARIPMGTAVQLGVKTRSRWEVNFVVVIAGLCSFSKMTSPLTKRDVAAHLGCSIRTADSTVSRMLRDKLIGRKRKPGKLGWCYFSTAKMIDDAPDQAEEDGEEETAKGQNSEIGDLEEQLSSNEQDTGNQESEEKEKQVRKILRMFDAPRMVLPGKESAPVAVPEGVQIRSIRVAETAESDMSLSWSDAVIDEQGEITVWVHGCRKKTATPHNESIPTVAAQASDADILRQVFELRFQKRVAAQEARVLGSKIKTALRGAPMEGYFEYVRDVKLPEKDKTKYPVEPPLFVGFATNFADKWADAQEALATKAQAIAVQQQIETAEYAESQAKRELYAKAESIARARYEAMDVSAQKVLRRAAASKIGNRLAGLAPTIRDEEILRYVLHDLIVEDSPE